MKSVKLIAGIVSACVFLTFSLAGCGQSEKSEPAKADKAADKVTIKVGYENNPEEPLDIAAKEWAKLVSERSSGRITLELFPSSQLGAKNDLVEQMKMGANVLTITDGSFLMDYVPDMGILSAPYLFDSYDQYFKVMKGNWFKEQTKKLEEKGLTIVAGNWIYGDRHTILKKEVKKPEDFNGLKVRTPNNLLFVKFFEAFGATPTPLAWGETYPALAQGVIDGAENPLSVLYGSKMYESAKYLCLTGHVKMISIWIGSSKYLKSLPADVYDIIAKAAEDAGALKNKMAEEDDKKAIEDFKKAGVTIVEVDKEAFKKAARPAYDKFTQWTPGLYDIVQKEAK